MDSKMQFKQGSIIDDVMPLTNSNKCQFSSYFEEVTVVQPQHPLCGQRCEVIQVSRADAPSITIKSPDGTQVTMPLGWTDYVNSSASSSPSGTSHTSHLLDINGLLDVVKIVIRIKSGDLETSQ